MLDDNMYDNVENEEKEDLLKNIDTSMFSSEQLEQQENIVEAILFMMGDSVSVDVLATALSKEHDIALAAVERLVKKYNTIYSDRGMKVIRINHKYQMVANNQYFQNLVLVASKPQKPVLTDAVLETLSIIAYKQPITKPEIENIRGVKSDFAVNRLIEYGLIEEKGRLDAPGRPIILGTTEEFLLRFGLESTDDLPNLPITREEEIKDEVAKELQKAFGEHVDVNEALNSDDVEDDVNDNEIKEDNVEKDKVNEINDENIDNDFSDENRKEEQNNNEKYEEDDLKNISDNELDLNNQKNENIVENAVNDDKANDLDESNDIIDNINYDANVSNNGNKNLYNNIDNDKIFIQEDVEKNEEIDIVDYEDSSDLNNLYNKNINENYETENITNQHFDMHVDTQKDEKIDGDDKEPQ